MITHEFARRFADEWIAAWNAHDLERVLSHYRDDFEMSSPFIIMIAGEPSGTLKGKDAVGAYWRRALELRPELHFELLGVFAGVDTICLTYISVQGLRAAEWFWFDDRGLVKKSAAHHDTDPAGPRP
jgi:hypothetical protein